MPASMAVPEKAVVLIGRYQRQSASRAPQRTGTPQPPCAAMAHLGFEYASRNGVAHAIQKTMIPESVSLRSRVVSFASPQWCIPGQPLLEGHAARIDVDHIRVHD
jgi:hypothetical protein